METRIYSFTDEELSQIRLSLQGYLTRLREYNLKDQATVVYAAYQKVGGYLGGLLKEDILWLGLSGESNAEKALMADATYTCYIYNRQRTPEIPPEQYRPVFPNVDELEKRFQGELTEADLDKIIGQV